MTLELERRWKKADYTIGRLSLNGEFLCNTLEDTDRGLRKDMDEDRVANLKRYGQTAIPTGKYKVILTFSPKFKRELPRLLDVPGFSGILLHRGNTHKDTLGCILVGENKAKGKVINSTKWEERIIELIRDAIDRGEKVFIKIE